MSVELEWLADGAWVCNIVNTAMLLLLETGLLRSLPRDRDWYAEPSLRSISSGDKEQIQSGDTK